MATVTPLTNGDNPGVATGVASGTVMGPSRHLTGAFTVLLKGTPGHPADQPQPAEFHQRARHAHRAEPIKSVAACALMTAPYYTAIQSRKEDIVKTRITLTLLTALTLAGCSTPPPPPPALNNDAIVSSEVNGVTLQHRAAVSAPKQFKPIGEEYRSLYAASIMSSPNYTGTAVGSLDNAAAFYALGEVENNWLAISAIRGGDLVGVYPGQRRRTGSALQIDAAQRSAAPRTRRQTGLRQSRRRQQGV